VEGAAGLFGANSDQEKEDDRALIAQLYQHIGELKVERDFLKDKLLIAEQIHNVQGLQSVVELAVWKRLHRAKLLTGEKAPVSRLGTPPARLKTASHRRSFRGDPGSSQPVAEMDQSRRDRRPAPPASPWGWFFVLK
jgi:hypothetical protein